MAKLMQCILLRCAYSAGKVWCWMNAIKLSFFFVFLRTVFSESTQWKKLFFFFDFLSQDLHGLCTETLFENIL